MFNKVVGKAGATMVVAAILMLSGCSSAEKKDESIKVRQDRMKNWNDARVIMRDMIKDPKDFDKMVFREHARFLASDSKSLWQHFEPSKQSDTVSPKVWENTEDWKFEIDKFEVAATELNIVAAQADTAQAVAMPFDRLTESCKSCHTAFKIKERK